MKLISYDTHAHIDLYKDYKECIKQIERVKSYTVVVTNLPKLYKKYILEFKDLKYVRFALGLHPQLVAEYKEQLELFKDLARDSKYIGEIGLDFSNGVDKEQTKVFESIIQTCSKYEGKTISIHSRKAAREVIDIVGESQNKIIMHWFTGKKKELEEAVDLNYYFSVNSDMISSNKGQEFIKIIPSNRLLIESDAPFTKLTKNSYNLEFIEFVFRRTAILLNKSYEDIREMYTENFKSLLK